MQTRPGQLRTPRRRPHDVHDGGMFRIGTPDGIDGAEFADAEGGDEGAHALDAAVAVGGVAGVELVAVPDPGQPRRGDVVERAEVVVTGDAVDGLDAELAEAGEEVGGQRDCVWRRTGDGRHGGRLVDQERDGLVWIR